MNPLSRALLRLPLAVRVLAVLAVYLVVWHVTADTAAASVMTTAMIIVPWQPPLSRDDLDLMANPMFANQPEVVPWQLYDTQVITTAVGNPAVFFQTINADKTLSNMEGPGQLPDPQYLVVQYVACDILQIPTTTALVAADTNAGLANVENLLKTVRATFEFNMSNKRYGPFSLTMCHATGGATFNGFGVGTLAAGVTSGVVNNGIPGSGGFPFSGALVIPPKIGFDVTVRFAAPPTLVAGPVNIRMSLVGPLYRRVL
jgi:hypothetical protein